MNASNAKEMMKYTGINQVHSSCKDWVNDATTHRHEVSVTCGIWTGACSGLRIYINIP